MNKFMNEYLKNINNEEENFKFIKTKLHKDQIHKRNVMNIAAAIVIVFLEGTLTPQIYAKNQQNINYKEYTRRDYVSGKGEIASAYSENIDMEYVFQNDIGVKVDSIVLTDDTFKANINIKLPEEMKKSNLLENNIENKNVFYNFGFAIYDENNNIFACNTRLDENYKIGDFQKYLMCLYKELGIKYNKSNFKNKMLSRQFTTGELEINDDQIIHQIDLNSWTGFPDSTKIYIRIFNIGYEISKYGAETETSKHNDLEWSFEIETPDKFLKRETIKLDLVDEIPKLNIEKFTLTETGLLLVGNRKDLIKDIKDRLVVTEDFNWEETRGVMLNITDENGNIYYPWSSGNTEEKNGFFSKFEIDKDLFESTTFYLNMRIGDEDYTSKIIKKE